MGYVGIGAIFAQDERTPRVFALDLLDPGHNVLELALIPAEVAVHALDVGIAVDRVVDRAEAVDCNGVAVRILGLAQVVDALCERGGIAVGVIHLVVDAPYIYRRVIEARRMSSRIC